PDCAARAPGRNRRELSSAGPTGGLSNGYVVAISGAEVKTMKETRRDFLKKTGGCALGMVTLATQMHHLGTMSAIAQHTLDSSGDGGENYRALVVLFFSGGNDGNNTVIPNHSDSSISNYQTYFNVRNTQGLALSQASLLPIGVPRLNNLTYGLHPSLGPGVNGAINNGIHEL